jgi:RNA polymerase sigma-70 factor (ECF subfamily)
MEETRQQQFLEAYDQYADDIFRFCLVKMRNRDEALDVMQETFTKTWEYLAGDKDVDNIRAFLYQVARNKIIDWSRKKKADSLDTILEAGVEFGDDSEQSEAVERKIDARFLVELIDELPQKYRDVVYFKYVEDLTIQEISDIVGQRENTVSVHLHRGLEKLEEIYNNQHE